ncbi:MAG: HEAT repeat domain-containing protein [Tomitella sp.]|nr:HEAT repeat domain-containing protein [Tomitella sp.]
MTTTRHGDPDTLLVRALAHADPSIRLRAALSAGTRPDARLADVLVDRCAAEPDFFVRDMLTWALIRLPASTTMPLLVEELRRGGARARSQALHTLSKIGDSAAWPQVSGLLHDSDVEVARSAWRAAVALVPPGDEPGLAVDLAADLGRGDRDVQLSLSRALVALGEAALPVLDSARRSSDPGVRAHAHATEALIDDPDSAFALSHEMAKRVAATGRDGEGGQAC